MSQLYTLEEVTADICHHEEVTVKSTVSDSVLFLKLYSQVYKSPMDGNKTVNDLNERISAFMNRCSVVLPPGTVIEWDKQFNVFEMTSGASIADSSLKLYVTGNSLVELDDIPVDPEKNYALVNTETRTVQYFGPSVTVH